MLINSGLSSQVGGVAENSVNEFFDTLITLAAYDGAREVIKKTTKDMQDGILKEAIENSLNVVAFGFVSIIVQKQEQIIKTLFLKYGSAIAAYLSFTSVKKFFISKLSKVKGFKFLTGLKIFKQRNYNEGVKAQVLAQLASAHIQAYQVAPMYNFYGEQQLIAQNYQLEREKHSAALAHYMQSALHDANILKLLTGKFTAKDKNLIKKLTGFDNIENKDIEALNHVKDFMFSFDADGNPIALTEAFVSLINTVGYYNKKSTKNP